MYIIRMNNAVSNSISKSFNNGAAVSVEVVVDEARVIKRFYDDQVKYKKLGDIVHYVEATRIDVNGNVYEYSTSFTKGIIEGVSEFITRLESEEEYEACDLLKKIISND